MFDVVSLTSIFSSSWSIYVQVRLAANEVRKDLARPRFVNENRFNGVATHVRTGTTLLAANDLGIVVHGLEAKLCL